MKVKYQLILIAALLLNLCSCKKDNTTVTDSSLIVGKWSVNKITIHQALFTVVNGNKDTTYTGSAFNASDYFQFNSNHTAVESFSAEFSINGKTTVTDGAGHPIAGGNSFAYSIAGSTLTLTSTLIVPQPMGASSGSATETIIQLDANNLVLRQIQTGMESSTTTNTYYTRAK
ncbi:MAG: hypothetical protein JWQ84_1563 [Mucilaginibacter sp.]|nr:hypothetical protein [Mucilaginibacter sp.]